jgi:hypothetical protein
LENWLSGFALVEHSAPLIKFENDIVGGVAAMQRRRQTVGGEMDVRDERERERSGGGWERDVSLGE